MQLDEFISKNQINLRDQVIQICEAGIEIMRRSINPLHDERHIFGILSNLDTFLETGEVEKSKINFEVLLLAICWHDVWRAKRFPLSLFVYLFDHVMEGTGSMGMFSQVSEVFGLDEETIKKTSYTIRKHSGFQILPLKSLEGRILKDLDSLEEWSLDRIKPMKEHYMLLGIMNTKVMKLAKFYFDHFMVKDLAKSFFFKWPKTEFERRKKVYVQEVNKFIAELLPFLPFLKKK